MSGWAVLEGLLAGSPFYAGTQIQSSMWAGEVCLLEGIATLHPLLEPDSQEPPFPNPHHPY